MLHRPLSVLATSQLTLPSPPHVSCHPARRLMGHLELEPLLWLPGCQGVAALPPNSTGSPAGGRGGREWYRCSEGNPKVVPPWVW
jgi:hypothetical protein